MKELLIEKKEASKITRLVYPWTLAMISDWRGRG